MGAQDDNDTVKKIETKSIQQKSIDAKATAQYRVN
jgi:hypothetical protein